MAVRPALAQCNMQVQGLVEDEDLHTMLVGAVVSIKSHKLEVITDESGRFLLKGLCPGKYDIDITHIGCLPVSRHIHVVDRDLVLEIKMPHAQNALEDVVVTGLAVSGRKTGAATLRGQQLEATRGESLSESLSRMNGVTTLQTGTNIYKPVINGLHSNRVLILNNGIRQEGQQWGSEHAPEIDPFIANRLTVIRGAGTLRYGHDGLGGVVLVEPHLLPATPGIRGQLHTGFFTNQRLGFISGMVEGNSQKHPAFAWRLQGTLRRGGNARTPQYFLANSGIGEQNFSATAGWLKPKKGLELFYSFFNTKLGIYSGSHIGNITDLLEVINSGEPPEFYKNQPFTYTIDRPFQAVAHHLFKAKAFTLKGETGRLNLLASWQYNRRKEYDIKRFSSSNNNPQLDIGLMTAGTDLVYDHFGKGPVKGTVGITTQYQQNLYYERFFIPNYHGINSGIFAIEKFQKNAWQLEAGLRYDYRTLFAIDRNNGDAFADRDFGGLSGTFSAIYTPSKNWWVSVNGSSAWRAPSINELYSSGLHHGAARLENGNANLDAERANGLMATLGINGSKWNVELSSFYKQIDGFIYLKPDFPPQLTIRGAFPVFSYAQTNARMHGFDASAEYLLNQHWGYGLKISLVRAWDKQAKDWIIQMPADRFDNSLSYHFSDGGRWRNTYIKLLVNTVLEQTRVPATGNIEITKPDGSVDMASDYAPPPPAYTLLGLEAGTMGHVFGRDVNLSLTGSNLLNKQYRNYMNAFRYYADDMGVNIGLKCSISLGGDKHKMKTINHE